MATGTALVPYERYRSENDEQIRRIQNDITWNTGVLRNRLVVVAVVSVFLVVLLFSLVGATWARWLVGVPIALVWGFSCFFATWGINEKKIIFVCPHCDQINNMGDEWRCGWCTASHDGMKLSPFSRCAHETCGKLQSAVLCTRCGVDIVFDKEAYRENFRTGSGRIPGIAVFKNGAERAVKNTVELHLSDTTSILDRDS